MQNLRNQIDAIDDQIAVLLHERFHLTDEVGRQKREQSLFVNDKTREDSIIKRLQAQSGNAPEIAAIYNTIFTLSKARQQKIISAKRFKSHILKGDGLLEITSPFGPRIHPVTGEIGKMHTGIDCALWTGEKLIECPICAYAPGIIFEAADTETEIGSYVSIDHGGGLITRYFHLEKGSICVKIGDKVQMSQEIGYMGKTGRCTGEHLHFQVELYGTPVDPLEYLLQK